MENAVPAYLFEMALESLKAIAELADSAESRAGRADLPTAAGITGGSLLVAGIRARASFEVLSRRAQA